MPSYRASGLGGIANSGIYGRPSSPDYSQALDSLAAAFANTRDAIIRRAQMQQNAQLARERQTRENEQLAISRRNTDLRESEYANRLVARGHDEIDPNVPHIGPDGKPLQVTRVGQRAFVLNPERTPEAIKKSAAATERETRKAHLRMAGAPESHLEALLDNASATADFLKTPRDLHSRIQSRIQELTSAGMPVEKANAQARLEMGEAPRSAGRTSTAGSPRPVTASQRERYLNQIADRAIAAAGGDVNKAAAALVQEPATADIFTQGLGASHMNAAAARYRNRTAGRGGGAAPSRGSNSAPASKGVLGDLVAGAPGTVPSNQPSRIRVPKNLPPPGAQASQRPPQADIDRAAKDPEYWKWLRSKGYSW
jgi:hypothetical protein